MPLVTWYKQYSVNNEELDNHHKNLFAILNKMYDSCLPANSSECAASVIEELIEYTDYHFTAEEKYMADKGYKEIDEHRQQHRYFLDKLLGLRYCEHKDDYDYKKEVMVLLGDWLLKHVTVEDKKYSHPLR
jgi:hemerythrin